MLARLGRVIYWFGCGFAAIAMGIAVLFAVEQSNSYGGGHLSSILGPLAGGLVAAALLWGLGRGARYILANE